jgi:hypothetical protein
MRAWLAILAWLKAYTMATSCPSVPNALLPTSTVTFVAWLGIVLMMLVDVGRQSMGTAEMQTQYDLIPLSESENMLCQLTSTDAGSATALPPIELSSKGTSGLEMAGGVGSHTRAVDMMTVRSLPHALASTTEE